MAIYAVKLGHQAGIYYTWKECLQQITGFSSPSFKKFEDDEEELAKQWLEAEPEFEVQKIEEIDLEDTDSVLIFTDGSSDLEAGVAGYGVVFVQFGEIIFRTNNAYQMLPEGDSANVGAELMAAMEGIRLAVINEYEDVKIVYDYEGVCKFITEEWKAENQLSVYYKKYINQMKDKVNISFAKVKAHSGNPYNEEADRLAALAISHFKEQRSL